MATRLIVCGLGNPGTEYEGTRHNLGFEVCDAFVARHDLKWVRPNRSYRLAEYESASTQFFVVKPQTYVNRSGGALRHLAQSLEFTPEELLVIADDIALPLGRLRLRRKGSHGGHNGIRSIIDALGSSDFPRLRLGVGPVPARADAADFVTDRFERSEEVVVNAMIDYAANGVGEIAKIGFDEAMNRYNVVVDPESD